MNAAPLSIPATRDLSFGFPLSPNGNHGGKKISRLIIRGSDRGPIPLLLELRLQCIHLFGSDPFWCGPTPEGIGDKLVVLRHQVVNRGILGRHYSYVPASSVIRRHQPLIGSEGIVEGAAGANGGHVVCTKEM